MDILLNWLWRGMIVAAAAHALVWALGPLSPRTRYRVWWAAMALTLFLPLLPALNDLWMPEVATPALVDRLSPLVSLPDSTSRVNVALLVLWAIWIALVGVRTLRAAAAIRAARQRARGFDPRLEQHLMRWSTVHGRGRRARLAVSEDVRLAAVLGIGSPMIAVSPAVIEALSFDDLDRVVVHEWAHVQRRDDLANALQLVVGSLVGWHPVAWWIGRQIDLERELACDEQACALTGGVKQYASCLATLASLTARGEVLPVPSALASSHLGQRVSRILALPRVNTGRWARGAATISTGALCLLASSIATVNLVDVYAADVVAALQGRSFMLPTLSTRDVAATRPPMLSGNAALERDGMGATAKPPTAQSATTMPVTDRSAQGEPVNGAPSTAAPLSPLSTLAAEPITAAAAALAVRPVPDTPPPVPPAASPDPSPRPWVAAADAGVAVGAGSQKAALATAAASSAASEKLSLELSKDFTVRIHLVNPSDLSFGTAVITPRWLYVLAAATPADYGDPLIVDETLDQIDPETVQPGDVVGIGIHTGNVLRGYKVGRMARERGAYVVYGGIHATLFPDEVRDHGQAHVVVSGDGELVWPSVLAGCAAGAPQPKYEGGRIDGASFSPARWDLLPEGRYMWGSVQTVRGCPKHCSFCSVWKTDGQKPRQRHVADVVREIVQLRRMGFRFVLLADDNFYPVPLADLAAANRRADKTDFENLTKIREERFELMARLAELPSDMVFYTQITMEAAEDPEFLDAMRKANIKGALVGIESVTPEGLKAVFKDFNDAGEGLVTKLQGFREHGVHVLGSFIFGLPTDKPDTFAATADLAQRAGVTFAQFVMLQPFPGTVDFAKWEKEMPADAAVDGIPLTRYWLIPSAQRPKVYNKHPLMSAEEIRRRTQGVWDQFYELPRIWQRSACIKSMRGRLAFLLVSKLYRQMYANTGIATDSARHARSAKNARILAALARRLFVAKPMPDLQEPAGLATRAPQARSWALRATT